MLLSFSKKTVQSALNAALTDYLGYEKHAKGKQEIIETATVRKLYNRRTGFYYQKPQSLKSHPLRSLKNQTRFEGLDKQIIALYAKGLSNTQIQDQLKEIYGIDCSRSLISTVLMLY